MITKLISVIKLTTLSLDIYRFHCAFHLEVICFVKNTFAANKCTEWELLWETAFLRAIQFMVFLTFSFRPAASYWKKRAALA